MKGHKKYITSVAAFRDTKENKLIVVTASRDATIRLWNGETG